MRSEKLVEDKQLLRSYAALREEELLSDLRKQVTRISTPFSFGISCRLSRTQWHHGDMGTRLQKAFL